MPLGLLGVTHCSTCLRFCEILNSPKTNLGVLEAAVPPSARLAHFPSPWQVGGSLAMNSRLSYGRDFAFPWLYTGRTRLGRSPAATGDAGLGQRRGGAHSTRPCGAGTGSAQLSVPHPRLAFGEVMTHQCINHSSNKCSLMSFLNKKIKGLTKTSHSAIIKETRQQQTLRPPCLVHGQEGGRSGWSAFFAPQGGLPPWPKCWDPHVGTVHASAEPPHGVHKVTGPRHPGRRHSRARSQGGAGGNIAWLHFPGLGFGEGATL